jgi:hypothetical protein
VEHRDEAVSAGMSRGNLPARALWLPGGKTITHGVSHVFFLINEPACAALRTLAPKLQRRSMGWQGLTIYDVRRNPTLWERHKISLRSFEPTNEEPSFVTLLRAQHGFLISEVRLFPLCPLCPLHPCI